MALSGERRDESPDQPEGCFAKVMRIATGRRRGEKVDEEEITEYEKGKVGVACCKPRWLQFLSNIWAFVFLYAPFAIWSVALVPFTRSQVSNIEKHFKISSSKMGTLFSMDEIGYCLSILPGAHYGKFTNIPRFLSICGLIIGVSFFSLGFSRVFLPVELPKTGSNSSSNENAMYLCNSYNSTIENEGKDGGQAGGEDSSLPWLFYYFAIVMAITGAMKSSRVSLSMFYIENNVLRKSQSGTLIGFLFAAFVFGWPIALFMGSFASKTPIDLQDTEMDGTDPRFIGAWWLGSLIIGACCIVTALPVFLLPKRIIIPKAKEVEVKHENTKFGDFDQNGETGNSKAQVESGFIVKDKPVADTQEKSGVSDLLGMPKSMLRVLKNPIVLFMTIESTVARVAFTGYSSFEQKYLEHQFNKTPADISFTLGAAQLAVTVLGTFVGGNIVSRFKMSRTGMGKFTLAVNLILSILEMTMLWFACEDQQIVGLSESAGISNSSMTCGCSVDTVLPVCGSNGVTYLSPCVAGCSTLDVSTFANCTEVNDGIGTVRPGQCDNGCPYFAPFMGIYVVEVLVGTVAITPRFMSISRSVKPSDQAMVMGVYGGIGLLLAGIPAPIVFGKIVDAACILWSFNGGECKVYSREDLKWKVVGSYLGIRWLANVIMFFCVYLMLRDDKMKATEKKETENADYKQNVISKEEIEMENYDLARRRISAISVESLTSNNRM